MKWKLASEGLPESDKEVNGRLHGTIAVTVSFFPDEIIIRGFDPFTGAGRVKILSEIEWLDESPTPIESAEVLLNALKKINEMNYQHAEDQYGDRNIARTWSCVAVAEEAMEAYANQFT